MDGRDILQGEPCQELLSRMNAVLEGRISSGLNFFLEKSCRKKETASQKMESSLVLFILIVHSLAEDDAFLYGILMELVEGGAPLDSSSLAVSLRLYYKIRREVYEKALLQARRYNRSGVILVPQALIKILITLISEAESGVGRGEVAETGATEASPGTSRLQESHVGLLHAELEKDPASMKGGGDMDLHAAASKNCRDEVEALLKKGEPVDAVNSEDETPLSVAVKNDFPAIVDVLLKNKADIQRKNGKRESYVHVAAASHSPAALRLLLKNGASVGPLNRRGESPLDVAIQKNDPEIIKILVELGASLYNRNGQTYLQEAIKNQSLNSLVALLECGVPPNPTDWDDKTALELAVELDDTYSATLLVEFGADVNQRWWYGNLLHCAADNDSSAAIRWLVERGLDLESTDSSRWTPLHYAASGGHIHATRTLVQLNCNLNPEANGNEWTPLDYAQNYNRELVAAYLRSVGATTASSH